MDLDSLIIWVILFFVFVLPSLRKRKQKKTASGQKKSTPGFGALKEKLSGFLRDLEQQALEAKRKAENHQKSGPGGRDSQAPQKKILRPGSVHLGIAG